MNARDDIDQSLRAFLAGRTPFDRVVDGLRSIVAGAAGAKDALAAALQDLVNSGRLPYDLAIMLWQQAAETPASTPDRAGPGALIPDLAAGADPDAGGDAGHDRYRDKVDEVVVSALLDGFRSFRQSAQPGGARRGEHADKHLDAALADFRGARFRREAAKAEAGQTRRQTTRLGQTGGPARATGVGSMLKDRFVLDKELGRGGMGVVYRAVDRRRLEAMHQFPYVAVKLLTGDFKEHPDAFRALENEARKAQELAHPNIVTIFDFDRDHDDVFLVMELLQGTPLDIVIASGGGRGLEPGAARRVINGLCEALAYAHARGVVHADVKPANVFVLADGEVKLLDFGIAAARKQGGAFNAESLGAYTAAYASPEMQDGAPRDPRDDVYALGCVAYMALAGVHPFGKLSGAEVRNQRLVPQAPAGASRNEWTAVARALSIQREARQPNAAAFRDEFRG